MNSELLNLREEIISLDSELQQKQEQKQEQAMTKLIKAQNDLSEQLEDFVQELIPYGNLILPDHLKRSFIFDNSKLTLSVVHALSKDFKNACLKCELSFATDNYEIACKVGFPKHKWMLTKMKIDGVWTDRYKCPPNTIIFQKKQYEALTDFLNKKDLIIENIKVDFLKDFNELRSSKQKELEKFEESMSIQTAEQEIEDEDFDLD